MNPKNSPSSPSANALSRRDFLAASAAAAACLLLDGRTAAALAGEQTAAGISASAMARATSRAQELVKQMALGEVIGQLGHRAPAIPRLNIAEYNYWTEALHGVSVKGPITSFPQPIALGCSWNPELVHRVYTAVSDEARAYHNKTGHDLAFFSPSTVNMGLRDPRWGRAEENFSEDPLLVSRLAVQTIHGMQGEDAERLKTIACAKHFICNDTDTDRDYTSAEPDKRSFWEYYTRGFEACVTEGKVFTVMAAYNSLWGIPCPANHMLLTEILRQRWGFAGYVVSDCDAVGDIYRTHGYVQTGPEAAALAINAGCDLNCGKTYQNDLLEAFQRSLVSEDALRQALVRVFTARVLLGEFDPPASVPWNSLSADILEGPAHQALAREAARQSLVLLKNENHLLPLKKETLHKVAVIGPMAGACSLGDYSGRPTWLVSPYMGIAGALGVEPYSSVIPGGECISTSGERSPALAFTTSGAPILYLLHNGWAQYGPFDLTGKTSIQLQLATIGQGNLSVYIDSLDAQPLPAVDVPNTGGLDQWNTLEVPLSGISSRHVLFLQFSSADHDFQVSVEWLKLMPVSSSSPQSSGVQIEFAPGCTVDGERNDAAFNNAVEAARGADVALLFVGINKLIAREGHDRDFLHLSGMQPDLVKAVVAANPRTVVVVVSNAPVAINWEHENAPAILCSLFGGEQQGNAIADALFGDYNPGGKLASTWFKHVSQLPAFHDYDIKHGRTYMYFKGEPLYPFGYGLSYTTFSYGNLSVSGNKLASGEALTISAEISNTGSVAGDEIVQFYVHAAAPEVRPIRQLAGFQRISLQPGEKKQVQFTLPFDHQALRYWDEATASFVTGRGDAELQIGSSSADIRLHSQFTVA